MSRIKIDSLFVLENNPLFKIYLYEDCNEKGLFHYTIDDRRGVAPSEQKGVVRVFSLKHAMSLAERSYQKAMEEKKMFKVSDCRKCIHSPVCALKGKLMETEMAVKKTLGDIRSDLIFKLECPHEKEAGVTAK